MTIQDLLFYILDAIIFVMMLRWIRNTKHIKLRSKVELRWLVPALFLGVMVIGFFRWEGTFSLVQTICLVVFAVMYWFVGSGLSEEGIVVGGALTKWEDAGTVSVKKTEACIIYKKNGRDAALYFDPDQLDEVRKFVADAAYDNHHNK